ncbi:MAG: DUF2400 domain-containing protein [Planctomycetes bacterium]|nr:DUF2400 domain-containing protein [Planctomycetota bacterium]
MDGLVASFGIEHISPDPLEVVRRYSDPRDIEVVGFLAAALAFGSARGAVRSVEDLLRRVTGAAAAAADDPRGADAQTPAAAVIAWDAARDIGRLRGWQHRWLGTRDAAAVLHILGRILRDHGSLEAFFTAGDGGAAGAPPTAPASAAAPRDIAPAISSFCDRALVLSPVLGRRDAANPARVAYWFAGPAKGGASKRLCLWLRWMCRRDQLDPGPWTSVDPARLVVPLDVHVARISRYTGLLRRRASDWRSAVEVTENLRRLDATDPVRYDYALCRLGVLGTCPRKRERRRCAACPLFDVCLL